MSDLENPNLQIDLHNNLIENDWRKHNSQLKQIDKHHIQQIADQSIQRLTYFVIGIEVVICGYLLLYIERLKQIPGLEYIFLFSGISAFCGLLWRFFWNLHVSNKTSSEEVEIPFKIILLHWFFVGGTVLLMGGIIILGTYFLHGYAFLIKPPSQEGAPP